MPSTGGGAGPGPASPRTISTWRSHSSKPWRRANSSERSSSPSTCEPALVYPSAGSHVDGEDERSLEFARRHGFEECDRQVEMVRGLAGPGPAPPPVDGIESATTPEGPQLLEQAYDLACEGYTDLKFANSSVRVTREEWVREEATLPAGSFVALADDEIVGSPA